jgi:DNA polymerase-4
MDRAIIHLNVADFAVAVERLADRQLAGKPVIIAPEGAVRATVYDMSEEAYQDGVRKGMPLRRARRLCRNAHILAPHTARYEQAMTDLLRQALPFSPLIEPGDDDGHLFVDVTGTSRLFGPPVDVAWRLRREAGKSLGLHPIWSLATNKLVAKVASRLVKPLGEYIVAPGDEADFLSPLPIWLIPGIEGRDLIRLREFNLTRVRQVTALTPNHLAVALGARSRFLADALRGVDPTPVLPIRQRPPRVALDHTFGTDTNTPAAVEAALYHLVERAGRGLRRLGRVARRIRLSVDYSDGRRCTRQRRVQPPTANEFALFPRARQTLDLAWSRRIRIRHLRLICDRLAYPPAQMPLFDTDRRTTERQDHLVAVMDRIRDRFGAASVRVGRSLQVDRLAG